MAIISFTNYKRGQTSGCMGAVMHYTMQDKKALWDGRRLVTGINCQAESVYADFMTTKRLYNKTDGVMFYHMVQSFPKGDAVDPVTAHAAALKLAEYYDGHEVLVCTHTDREHIHSHLIINSVNFDTGRKLHIARDQLQELRQRNDQVCMDFSLPVFQPRETRKKSKTMTIGEYHTADRGQSKKLQLMNIINDCMRHAHNRKEFIALMESEGYKVRWEKSRRSITYTTPSGWKCRDRLLFGDKYLKENMEYEFRIREEIIYGRTLEEESSRAGNADHTAVGSYTGGTSYTTRMVGDAGLSRFPESPHGDADQLSKAVKRATNAVSDPEANGRNAETDSASGADGRTGWELERKIFLSAQNQTSQSVSARTGWSDVGISADVLGGVVSAMVVLPQCLDQPRSDAPIRDSTASQAHTDRKAMRKQRQKKIALGHAEDKRTEQFDFQMNM